MRVLLPAALALTVAGSSSAGSLGQDLSDARPALAATALDATAETAAAAAVVVPGTADDAPRAERLERLRVERVVRVSRDAPRRSAPARSAERAAQQAEEWRLPLPAGSYRLSAGFGECGPLWSRCHTGLDLSAPSGTPVLAVAAGEVAEASYAGAYGNRVVLELADGTEVWLCHLTSFAVGAGQAVGPGEVVGTVGSTGNSTGPHLHLEVHPAGGDAVDPAAALAARGVTP